MKQIYTFLLLMAFAFVSAALSGNNELAHQQTETHSVGVFYPESIIEHNLLSEEGSTGHQMLITPPGWEYVFTSNSHLIAVTTDIVFQCINLSYGDYIGVFYTDDDGEWKCGGAAMWDPDQNIPLVAYGNDMTTFIKDGFDEEEKLTWKVYYSQSGDEQFIHVTYSADPMFPNNDGKFHTNGLSALTTILNPLHINALADTEIICFGETVQLGVEVNGGCGENSFLWSSQPDGFSSIIPNPAVNPAETTTFFVTVSNQYGDVVTDSVMIVVNPLPQLSCSDDMMACENDEPVLLDSALPNGGVYSGAGVFYDGENYWFDPLEGVGVHAVSYCYADPDTGCVSCCEFLFEVHPLPEIACPDDFTVCLDDDPFVLTGGLPEGGIYEGEGVSNGGFNPATAGAGDQLITYTFSNPLTFCVSSCTFTITVIEVDVTCPDDFSICIDAEPQLLTGGFPEGGIYEGAGVVDGFFDPSLAGVGMHVVTYTWIYPETNCAGSCTFFANVYPLPQLSCPEDIILCMNSESYLLNNASPENGDYSGTGVFYDDGFYYFDPSVGVGSYLIIYCYTDPVTNCADCCELVIEVTANQIIELTEGWSGISGFIVPDNSDIVNLTYPITYPLIQIYNLSGVYRPGENINTLGDWDVYSGYIIKVSYDAQLPLCGAMPENKTVALNEGWNLIPVLSETPVSISALFQDVPEVEIVKEVAGFGIFWPQYDINTIGELLPGKAYFVRMNNSGSIDFSDIMKMED
jgi:hypothetical protein